MMMTVVINVLNIFSNLFFVYGLQMRSDGVALGTVTAQYLGLGLAVWILKSRKTPLRNHDGWGSILSLRSLHCYFIINLVLFF